MSRAMTEDASDLTFRATGPSVLAAIVRGTVEAAVAAGVDRRTLLGRMRLTEGDLADPDRPVPLEAHTVAWECLGEHPAAETLALEVARHLKTESLGVFGWVVAHAPTARDVFAVMTRYRSLFGDPYTPQVELSDEAVVIHRVFEPRIARTRVMPEYAPATTLVLLRDLLGLEAEETVAREVWFQHGPPRDPSVHERFFGCAVRWSAPETRFVIDGGILGRAPRKADPHLHAYLDRHALALSASLASGQSVTERVRALVVDMLREGEPSQADVAKKLAMSPRTLQRRLEDESRTFGDVLESVRRELAARYLADQELAIYEVAFLLGYADASSFHRAFRRWTGEGPQEFRSRVRGRR